MGARRRWDQSLAIGERRGTENEMLNEAGSTYHGMRHTWLNHQELVGAQ